MVMVSKSMVVMLMVVVVQLFAVSNAGSSEKDNAFVDCELRKDKIVVDMGWTHPPTLFWIVAPDEEVFQVVNPGKRINFVGARYRTGKFSLSTASKGVQTSESGKESTGAIFVRPGRYSLRFQDANTTSDSTLRSFACEVDINGVAVIGSDDSQMLYATNADGSAAMFPVGCNYLSNCAGTGKPCCKKNTDGGLCYCSSCCIARPAGAALASADSSVPYPNACDVR